MKQLRFWLFTGVQYEEHGGMNDFYQSFATENEALNEAVKVMQGLVENVKYHDWYHIYDLEEDKIIKSYSW